MQLDTQTGEDRAFQNPSDIHLAAILALVINEQKRMGAILDEIAASLSAAHSPRVSTHDACRDSIRATVMQKKVHDDH